jgi:pyroglutamyl-peptidase
MRILVTGFAPFGGETLNPSWEVTRRLPERLGDIHIRTAEIPTTYALALPTLKAALRRHRPQAVLLLGLAGGRFAMTPERVAINIDEARIADNAGEQRIGCAIVPHGPAAYFSTLPIRAMVAGIRAQGIPAEISNSAGTFLCNHLMYGVLHHLAVRRSAVRAGFMHVPYLPAQVVAASSQPSLALDDLIAGTCAALVAIATHREDLATTEGALH